MSLSDNHSVARDRAVVMLSTADLYLCVRDNEIEVSHIPARTPAPPYEVIRPVVGVNPTDNAFIDEGLREANNE